MQGKEEGVPFVSVIVPALNEEKFVGMCLESLLNQDYPSNRYEIVAVDDNSVDRTFRILQGLHEKYPERIKLFTQETDHPYGVGAEVRRTAIRHSRGEIIVNFSAHAVAQPGLIFCLVKKLLELGEKVGSVGCKYEMHPDSSALGKAIMLARTSFFGGFGTSQRPSHKPEFVYPQATFAAYRRRVLEGIGRYPLGGDSELNILISRVGYKQYYIPETGVHYFWRPRRGSKHPMLAFLKRMINYGASRARDIRSYPNSFKLIYILPSALVILFSVGLAGLLTPLNALLTNLLVFPVIAYLIGATVSSIVTSSKAGLPKIAPLVFFSYLITHFGYGIGFISGFFKKPKSSKK